MNIQRFEGKTALITGASSDLGLAFAEALARRGTHLILVAPEPGALPALAARFNRLHAVSVEVIAADLTASGAPQRLCTAIEQMGRSVDMFVNQAEVRGHTGCDTCSPGRDQQGLLTAEAVADLTSAFLSPMLARGRGAIVHVAAPAALQPLPKSAGAGATNTFLRAFSHALHAETRPRGVQIVALFPDTPYPGFCTALSANLLICSSKSTPAVLVAQALQALERSRRRVMPGRLSGWRVSV